MESSRVFTAKRYLSLWRYLLVIEYIEDLKIHFMGILKG